MLTGALLAVFFVGAFYVAANGGIRGTLLRFNAPDYSTLEAKIEEFGLRASDQLRAGPRGQLWVAAAAIEGRQTGGDRVLQVSPSGHVARLKIRPGDFTRRTGSDRGFGSLAWFVFPAAGGHEIVATDSRGAFSPFPKPVPLPQGSEAELMAGIGRSLWFTRGGPGIGTVSDSGNLGTLSPLPEDPDLTVSHLSRGAEGRILASARSGAGFSVILEIGQTGDVRTFRLPSTGSFGNIEALAACPHGTGWFSMDTDPPRLGFLTKQGGFRSWRVPSPLGGWIETGAIACLPTGDVWFKLVWQTTVNEFFGQGIRDVGMIGRLTPEGQFDRAVVPTFTFFPTSGLAVGGTNAVWYKHRSGVGRLEVPS